MAANEIIVKISVTDIIEFKLGDIVYLKIDKDNEAGMITAIRISPSSYSYYVTWTDKEEAHHYGMELTTEKNYER